MVADRTRSLASIMLLCDLSMECLLSSLRCCSPGYRVRASAVVLALATGCHQSHPIPKITGELSHARIEIQSVPGYGLASRRVDVLGQSEMASLYEMISPAREYTGSVGDDTYPLIALVRLVTSAGEYTVYVRTYGKNPALVSFDNTTYYLARRPSHPDADGALDVIRFADSCPQAKP